MSVQSNCPSIGSNWERKTIGQAVNIQKWYKPILSVDTDLVGNQHVYKVFRFSRGLLGKYFRFLASHEFRMLKAVEDLDFTPSQISRSADTVPAINYHLIEGQSIKAKAAAGRLPQGFFGQLFRDVKTLHQHGVVHMDLGNSGNILVSPEGHPAIIDFGSAVPLHWLPPRVQRWALRKDIVGMLKLWHRFEPETMPPFLLDYFHQNYRKNIYTPKRFLKAARQWLAGEGSADDLSDLTMVAYLFAGLLVLVSFI